MSHQHSLSRRFEGPNCGHFAVNQSLTRMGQLGNFLPTRKKRFRQSSTLSIGFNWLSVGIACLACLIWTNRGARHDCVGFCISFICLMQLLAYNKGLAMLQASNLDVQSSVASSIG